MIPRDAASRRWCHHCPQWCLSPWPAWPACPSGSDNLATPLLSVNTVPDPHRSSARPAAGCRSWSHYSPKIRQHSEQEAASTELVSPKLQSPLLSLFKLMDVSEDQLGVSPSGSGPPPGLIRPLVCRPWLYGGAEAASLSSWASSSSPTLFLMEDPAMANQFSLLRNWSAMAGSSNGKRVGKRKRPSQEGEQCYKRAPQKRGNPGLWGFLSKGRKRYGF